MGSGEGGGEEDSGWREADAAEADGEEGSCSGNPCCVIARTSYCRLSRLGISARPARSSSHLFLRGIAAPALDGRRILGEYIAVPLRSCAVSFTDAHGMRHTVEVTAETLLEAAALALHVFKQPSWFRPACMAMPPWRSASDRCCITVAKAAGKKPDRGATEPEARRAAHARWNRKTGSR